LAKKHLGKSYGFDEKLHLVLVEWPTTCGLDIVHLFVDKTTTKCQAICSHKDDLSCKGSTDLFIMAIFIGFESALIPGSGQ
jgi:hypothetical protein